MLASRVLGPASPPDSRKGRWGATLAGGNRGGVAGATLPIAGQPKGGPGGGNPCGGDPGGGNPGTGNPGRGEAFLYKKYLFFLYIQTDMQTCQPWRGQRLLMGNPGN